MKLKKTILIQLALTCFSIASANTAETENLKDLYEYYCHTQSDIQGHIPRLKKLATECSSVIEIGVRSMVSTWGILQGLSENPSTTRSYIGVDLYLPPIQTLNLARKLANDNKVFFTFLQGNDMTLELPSTELLFIDSLHTYCHLTYELEKFSPNVTKYIVMHDTSDPWGGTDEHEYTGDYSEYPPYFNRNKRGLWPAVEDFLVRHPEWKLEARYFDYHGLTILKRVN